MSGIFLSLCYASWRNIHQLYLIPTSIRPGNQQKQSRMHPLSITHTSIKRLRHAALPHSDPSLLTDAPRHPHGHFYATALQARRSGRIYAGSLSSSTSDRGCSLGSSRCKGWQPKRYSIVSVPCSLSSFSHLSAMTTGDQGALTLLYCLSRA